MTPADRTEIRCQEGTPWDAYRPAAFNTMRVPIVASLMYLKLSFVRYLPKHHEND